MTRTRCWVESGGSEREANNSEMVYFVKYLVELKWRTGGRGFVDESSIVFHNIRVPDVLNCARIHSFQPTCDLNKDLADICDVRGIPGGPIVHLDLFFTFLVLHSR